MKVVFICKDQELFKILREQFEKAKEADEWDLASLQLSENSATYLTCCGNKWWTELKDGVVYFGYEGTRAGVLRLTPFPQLAWSGVAENSAVLRYVMEWQEYKVAKEDGSVFQYVRAPKLVKDFQLEVVEYATTTPAEWNLAWHDQVEKVSENQAVIMRHDHPIKVVPYKNVYKR